MRISDWSSDVCSSDLQARLTAYESAGVGWVRKLQVKIVEDGFSQLRAVFAHLADRCADDATRLFGLFELVVKRIENARADGRSEGRRVGKEVISPCNSRWSTYH